MSFVSKRLHPEERISVRSSFHWIHSVSLAGVLTLFVWPWIERKTTELVLTNKRLVLKQGLIAVNWQEIPLEKIEETEVRQSILGRILGYGTVEIKGSGSGVIRLGPIPNPYELTAKLSNQTE